MEEYWQDDFGFGQELMMRELLDEAATAAPSPVDAGAAAGYSSYSSKDDEEEEEEYCRSAARRRPEQQSSTVNKLISAVYSGPTLSDIESALSFSGAGAADPLADGRKYSSTPVVFSPEKMMSKMENKYTMKIKTCGNGLADDGYKWRKYGQKSIKNSPNPRSYYRCTNPRCNAKKQVERSTEEPDTLLVTYEGLHLHYTYSHFLQAHHHPAQPQAQAQTAAGSKKPKLHSAADITPATAAATTTSPPPSMDSAATVPATAAAAADGENVDGRFMRWPAAVVPNSDDSSYNFFDGSGDIVGDAEEDHQGRMTSIINGGSGLLEDMVPLLVRRPSSGNDDSAATTTTTTNSSSTSTLGSPAGAGAWAAPSPSTSSSVSWNPASPYIDMAILSNIF